MKTTSKNTQNRLSAFVSRQWAQKAINSSCQPVRLAFLVALTLGMVVANHSLANAAILEVNGSAPHLCASTNGGSNAAGTAVIAYSCSGAFWQQWEYSSASAQLIALARRAVRPCASM